ncbi:MAG: hypothetical protein PVJ86_03135 [Phycisphaerales bacterium]|jgi:hypothetical protein
MRSTENIKKLIKNLDLDIDTNRKTDRMVLSELLEAQEKSKKTSSAFALPNVRIIIMKSTITKLAAAAVIITAVLIGINQFGRSSAAYAITDMPELLGQAKTIHVKGWTSGLKVPVEGEEHLERHQVEHWYDMENGRCRTMGFAMRVMMPDEKRLLVKVETVFDGYYEMQINHSSNSVTFYKLTEFMRNLSIRRTLDRSLEEISLTPEELADFEKVGQDQLEGMGFDVWEKKTSYDQGGREVKSEYWVSPVLGKIARFRSWEREQKTEGEWRLTSERELELNVAPPEGVFETVPPLEYSLNNTKETASVHRLVTQPFGWRDSVQGEIAVVIALPNGVAIMGWYAEDPASDSAQAGRFEYLEIGGTLPKMCVEIAFGLWPTYSDQNVTYVGRHLAETEKDGRFYEWAIFVPNKDVDASRVLRRSKVRIGLHPDNREGVEGQESNDFYVETVVIQEDGFDLFVRGAMAELSDERVAPAYVTYENVLKLSADIRASMEE